MTEPGAPPDKFAWYRRRRWWLAGAVLLLSVIASTTSGHHSNQTSAAGSSGGTEQTTLSTSTTGAPTTSTAAEDDGLSGSGAPTVAGSIVPAGAGTASGPDDPPSGPTLSNVYHPNRLTVMSPCMTLSGTVESVRAEADGDTHFDLAVDPQFSNLLRSANSSDQHGWLVDEIVPADEPGCHPGQPPRPPSGSYDYGTCTGADEIAPAVGSHVYVTGPYVLDEDHGGWAEIHPVWAISSLSPSRPPTTTAQASPSSPTTAAPATTVAAAQQPTASASCSASVSNPTPGDGGDETVSVTSNLPQTAGTVTAHYKTTSHQFQFTTDGIGRGQVTFSIGHPTVGYTVRVDVDLSGRATCSTQFTPQ